MGDRPSSFSARLRPLAAFLPERVRSRLAFALAYAPELAQPVGRVFLREWTDAGRSANRTALAARIDAVVRGAGIDLDPRTDPGAVREVIVDREYERPGFLPDAATTVLDVGAQHGEFAVLCAKAYHARVLAFEPVPSNVEIIRANLRRNAAEEVTVYPIALGDRDGEIDGYRYDTMLVRDPGRFPARAEHYRQQRLDSLGVEPALSNRRVIIKVDVEGFEREVLAGGAQLIRAVGPLLIIESDRQRVGDVELFLRQANYTTVFRRDKPTGCILFATPGAPAPPDSA
ncbi:MAG: FkbM family methyltransferase [Thermoplasmata archaeon]|nr:FkbM family methyltransferase [Thermoplasmata archaeon]